MADIRHFDIDIVGGCNLSCPSCPVGNSDYAAVPKGYMKPAMLAAILDKAIRECGNPSISLYNWTEPFLHPNLPAMIKVVKDRGLKCTISSNLNILRNTDAVLRASPDVIRVSVSGFWQESYGVTHREGDIERVKRNMKELAEARKATGSSTHLVVLFHKYVDNIADEREMKAYAERLGYRFKSVWAYFMPIEKVIDYATNGRAALTRDDEAIINKLALPIDAALEISRIHGTKNCQLLEGQIALTVKGDVLLCCGAYDQKRLLTGSYLADPLDSIQEKRRAHPLCGDCVECGANSLAVYEAEGELDRLAEANVGRHNAGVHHIQNHFPGIRRRFETAIHGLRLKTRPLRRALGAAVGR